MSRGRRGATPVVSRAYEYTPHACERALTILLKKPVKEGGPATAPDDAKERSSELRAKTIIPEPS